MTKEANMLSETSEAIDKLELRPRNKEKSLDKDFFCNAVPCLLLWSYITYPESLSLGLTVLTAFERPFK